LEEALNLLFDRLLMMMTSHISNFKKIRPAGTELFYVDERTDTKKHRVPNIISVSALIMNQIHRTGSFTLQSSPASYSSPFSSRTLLTMYTLFQSVLSTRTEVLNQ